FIRELSDHVDREDLQDTLLGLSERLSPLNQHFELLIGRHRRGATATWTCTTRCRSAQRPSTIVRLPNHVEPVVGTSHGGRAGGFSTFLMKLPSFESGRPSRTSPRAAMYLESGTGPANRRNPGATMNTVPPVSLGFPILPSQCSGVLDTTTVAPCVP